MRSYIVLFLVTLEAGTDVVLKFHNEMWTDSARAPVGHDDESRSTATSSISLECESMDDDS